MYKKLKVIIAAALLTVIASGTVFGQDYPYEWLSLGISEKPSELQRVRWRTPTSYPYAAAEISPATPTPDFWDSVTRCEVNSSEYNDYGKIMMYHHVTFDGLEPGRRYMYRIGDGQDKWSEWYEFTTARDDDSPFTFIYISDVQVGIHDQYPRVIRQATTMSADASFIMFTGDLTGGASEWEWNAFFRANGWLPGMKPVAAVPDSHEYAKKEGEAEKTLTTYWDHIFSYPENTPATLSEQGNYYFDYQGCRFIMINTKELLDGSEDFRSELLRWIESLLSDNPHRWTVVGQHRPVYPMAEGRGPDAVMEYLKPLYDKYDVDLVLTGHDHIYGRMRGEQNDRESDELKGPVYVVSVAGPQVYVPEFHTYAERTGSNIQLYQTVTVNNDEIDFKAYLSTGELYDHFTIAKPDGEKRFTDKSHGIDELLDIPTRTWQKYTPEDYGRFRRQRELYIKSKNRP